MMQYSSSSCRDAPDGPVTSFSEAGGRKLSLDWTCLGEGGVLHCGLKSARIFVATLLCLAVVACQGVDSKDVLDIASAPAMPAGDEVLGTGSVNVALIVARGAPGQSGAEAVQYRNGAVLAMSDLGTDYITLSVLGSGGDAATARDKTNQALNDGARLIIGPTLTTELDAVAGQRKRGQPPVLALVDNATKRAAGVFTLRSDEIDGALAVGAYAAAAGRGDVLVIAGPGGISRDATSRLKGGLEKNGGRLLGVAEYSASGALTGAGNLASRAQAVIILAGANPEQAIAAVRGNGLATDALVLGTAQWGRQYHTSAALAGALVPMADQSGLRQIEARMRAAYGQPMSMEAAYGYDAVALAAGLVRAVGPDGLQSSVLKQPVGFKGATGAFRFGEDGAATRLYGIYRASKDGLKPVQPVAQEF